MTRHPPQPFALRFVVELGRRYPLVRPFVGRFAALLSLRLGVVLFARHDVPPIDRLP